MVNRQQRMANQVQLKVKHHCTTLLDHLAQVEATLALARISHHPTALHRHHMSRIRQLHSQCKVLSPVNQ